MIGQRLLEVGAVAVKMGLEMESPPMGRLLTFVYNMKRWEERALRRFLVSERTSEASFEPLGPWGGQTIPIDTTQRFVATVKLCDAPSESSLISRHIEPTVVPADDKAEVAGGESGASGERVGSGQA